MLGINDAVYILFGTKLFDGTIFIFSEFHVFTMNGCASNIETEKFLNSQFAWFMAPKWLSLSWLCKYIVRAFQIFKNDIRMHSYGQTIKIVYAMQWWTNSLIEINYLRSFSIKLNGFKNKVVTVNRNLGVVIMWHTAIDLDKIKKTIHMFLNKWLSSNNALHMMNT